MAALTRDVMTRFLADTSQMNQATKQVATNTGQMGKSFSQLAGFAKAGIAAMAGSGVISALGSMVTASTALGESVNAVNVVFGQSASKIHKWAEGAAESAGLAHSAANNLIVPIGAALQNVGLSADEAAEKSIALAQRAADMASVFNVDVSDALGAIQAGLRGEADPLERFGVGLSAAKVEAFLLSEGIVKTKSEITDSMKVVGRYGLLMKETEKVAGDFANTSDSLANQQRILAAELENTKAKMGDLLVPIMQAATGDANDFLTVMGALFDMLEGGSGTTEEAAKEFKNFGDIAAGIAQEGWLATIAEMVRQVEEQELAAAEAAGIMEDAMGRGLQPAIEAVTESIYEQIDAFRASNNPAFAALKAVEQLTKAGEAYTRAVSEHGPKSDEARDAAIELALAHARAEEASQKYAEEGGQAAIDALVLLLQTAGVAKSSIDQLIASLLNLNKTPITKVPFTSGGGGGGGTFAFHEGGVVPGPRGQEQWVLAKGGETILPTHKGPIAFSGSGGGGPVVYMTNYTLDPNVIQLRVREALEMARRGG